jgi:hypothetical protein
MMQRSDRDNVIIAVDAQGNTEIGILDKHDLLDVVSETCSKTPKYSSGDVNARDPHVGRPLKNQGQFQTCSGSNIQDLRDSPCRGDWLRRGCLEILKFMGGFGHMLIMALGPLVEESIRPLQSHSFPAGHFTARVCSTAPMY